LGVDFPHGVDDSAREKVANWGLPPFGRKRLDLHDLVYGHADLAILVLDEHDRAVRTGRTAVETGDQVDHGDDGATDVYQSAHVRRRPGETRGRRRREYLPHDLQLDRTGVVRQPEEKQLAGRYVGRCVR
jgi:hypothetical protein